MPPEPTVAFYVRLPSEAAARLERAANARGTPKKAIVADLLLRHLDDEAGGPGPEPVRVPLPPPGEEPFALGHHTFVPAPAPEVLTPAQAAELFQVDEHHVLEVARAGSLPGRRIGGVWRFSRAALVDWLASGTGGR